MQKSTWSNYKRSGIWVDPPLFFQNSHIFPFFLATSLKKLDGTASCDWNVFIVPCCFVLNSDEFHFMFRGFIRGMCLFFRLNSGGRATSGVIWIFWIWYLEENPSFQPRLDPLPRWKLNMLGWHTRYHNFQTVTDLMYTLFVLAVFGSGMV